MSANAIVAPEEDEKKYAAAMEQILQWARTAELSLLNAHAALKSLPDWPGRTKRLARVARALQAVQRTTSQLPQDWQRLRWWNSSLSNKFQTAQAKQRKRKPRTIGTPGTDRNLDAMERALKGMKCAEISLRETMDAFRKFPTPVRNSTKRQEQFGRPVVTMSADLTNLHREWDESPWWDVSYSPRITGLREDLQSLEQERRLFRNRDDDGED